MHSDLVAAAGPLSAMTAPPTPPPPNLPCRALREDRTLIAAADLIATALGQRFVDSVPLNMERAWAESRAAMPLICLLSPGRGRSCAVCRWWWEVGTSAEDRETCKPTICLSLMRKLRSHLSPCPAPEPQTVPCRCRPHQAD